jgi:hypothetical protein
MADYVGLIQSFIMINSELLIKNNSRWQEISNTWLNRSIDEIWWQWLVKLCSKFELGDLFTKFNGHQKTVLVDVFILIEWKIFDFEYFTREETKIAHRLRNFWIKILLLQNIIKLYIDNISERLNHWIENQVRLLVSIYLIWCTNIDNSIFISDLNSEHKYLIFLIQCIIFRCPHIFGNINWIKFNHQRAILAGICELIA